MPPRLVRSDRRRHKKTDRTDTKALLEAARNEEIEPVPIKIVEQRSVTATGPFSVFIEIQLPAS